MAQNFKMKKDLFSKISLIRSERCSSFTKTSLSHTTHTIVTIKNFTMSTLSPEQLEVISVEIRKRIFQPNRAPSHF